MLLSLMRKRGGWREVTATDLIKYLGVDGRDTYCQHSVLSLLPRQDDKPFTAIGRHRFRVGDNTTVDFD